MHRAEQLIDALVRGALEDARALLSDDVTVDDPRCGRTEGAAAAERWLAGEHAWLAGLSARTAPVRLTVEGRDAVLELLLRVKVAGEKRQVPLAVAFEAGDDERFRAVRVYHSFWPLERRHHARGRVLPARTDLVLRPPVDAYQRALAAGDVDAVLACYERSATVREPAGEPFLHKGPRGLRRLYGTFLLGGGIPLEHGHVVDDGVACALEYTVVRWGRTELPPQAGLAVYERGPTGRIRATRLYDDVDPPRD